MLVNFQVRFANRRVQQIVANLKRNQSADYATRIDMAGLAEMALSFIRKYFPGRRTPQDNTDTEKGYEGHLAAGWKVDVLRKGALIGFDFQNTVAQRSKKARDVLHYLDAGTAQQTIKLKTWAVFAGTRSLLSSAVPGTFAETAGGRGMMGDIFLRPGSEVNRPARPGYHFYEAARKDVMALLLPVIRQRISSRLSKV